MPVEKLFGIAKATFGMNQEDEQGFKIDLVNQEGLLIYSSYNRKGMSREILPDWEHLNRFLKSEKKAGSFRHHYLGEDFIHAFAFEQGYLDFKGMGWILIIHAPTKLIFGPAVELRNRLILVLLIVGFLACLIIFFFSYSITKPLARLSHASIEIGKGNLDVKVEMSSKDEIGQLSVSFNKMVGDLKEYRDRLLAYSSELETKVAERTIELKNANERLQLELIERKRAEEEREKLVQELQKTLAKVKTLSGLIPICASCKKIRDDKGYWGQIESYIRDHSEAEFSHGICPDCMKKLYPDFAEGGKYY